MQSFLEPESPGLVRWWPLAALVVGIATVFSVFTGYPAAPAPAASSAHPTLQSRVLQSVTSLQGKLHRLPNDSTGWAQLGSSYVELARITVDPAYYAKAQGALDRSLQLKPQDNALALLGMGALANSRHDFGAARDWGIRALAVAPTSAEVHGVLADAYTQLGDDQAATDAVQKMLDLKPNVASFTRASYYFETHGRIDEARMALERALQAAGAPDEIAFCRYYLGELAFNAGRLDEADSQYSRGLELVQDQTLLQGKAKVAAARGDIDRALDGYRTLVTRAPLPQYIQEYGELLDAAGRPAEAAAQYEILAQQHKLMAAQGATDDLSTALMLADHGDKAEALSRAEAEWGRRQNVLVADAMAWALHVNGRDAEALPYMDKAAAFGWDNALFAYHRGMIHSSLGQLAEAEKYLSRALEINPNFSVLHAPLAKKRLAELRVVR
ncbi:tetratricopeptide (TPR) repeat protein [Kibdelosporangium banguiense]|uniref:Tetratricopeptide (TPR) repeat protein n=1 Tax=Kibdelosporangium banguiense TaxID=1365924 RepID=A0ABS4TZT8_9PSEU|nr:tetratricopeptide repeat protein [Kibdelosporangium banguiense]MBP2329926.1 tetratricopeptide (TPR) repeat protein [Kibdelosporangium banguiense]